MASASELLEAVRPDVIARVVAGRPALKLGLAAQSPEAARAQLDAVLDRIGALAAAPDSPAEQGRHLGFVIRWVAYHLGEGFSPEDIVHAIVTLGDLLGQGARERLPAGSEALTVQRDVTRATRALVRLVVDVLGAELGKLDTANRPTVIE